jgi:hypothetical protein
LRNLRSPGDRADETAFCSRAQRRNSDLLLYAGDAAKQPAFRRGLDAAPMPSENDDYDIYHEFTPGIRDLHHKYIDVMHVDEVIAHLHRLTADRPAAVQGRVASARR